MTEHTVMILECTGHGSLYRIEGDLIVAKLGIWDSDGSEKDVQDVTEIVKRFISGTSGHQDTALYRYDWKKTFPDSCGGAARQLRLTYKNDCTMFVPEKPANASGMDSFAFKGNLKKATWGVPTSKESYRNIDVTEIILELKKANYSMISDGRRYYYVRHIAETMDPFIGEKKTLKLCFGKN